VSIFQDSLFNSVKKGEDFVYIEVATNEPIRHSNTYVLEKCYGWKGICVEPNPAYHKSIKNNRNCVLEPYCVSDGTHDKIFEHREGASRIVDTKRSLGTQFTVSCLPLEEILEKNRISHVHYFSLDVEGHEYQVLKTIDWSKRSFDLITVESPSVEVIRILSQHEIYQVLCIGPDGLFANGHYVDKVRNWFTDIGEDILQGCVTSNTASCMQGNAANMTICSDTIRRVLKKRGGKKNKLLDATIFNHT
jgi:FkbM family methyltransferase